MFRSRARARARRERRPPTPEELAWRRRAGAYRRQVNYCQLCEARDVVLCRWWVLEADLTVHHCYGRGWLSPLGQEADFELRTLCRRCHAKITARHNRAARRCGAVDSSGRIRDPARYAECVRDATDAAHPRYWARAWRRTFTGRPRRGGASARLLQPVGADVVVEC